MAGPERERQLHAEQAVAVREQGANQVLNQRAQMAQDYHSRLKSEHAQFLKQQLDADKVTKAALDDARRRDDANEAHRMAQANSQFAVQRAAQKNNAVAVYKSELDQQIQNRQAMRAYGNMTSVEKEINKGELQAWKNFDSGQVAALVPGASNAVPRYAQKNPSPQ